MSKFDLEYTFRELVANGHTRFQFCFERNTENGVERFEDTFYLLESQEIVEAMEYCDGQEVWIPISVE
jgi:hypothetical protein